MAMFTRDATLVVAVLVQVPTVARFAGKTPPRLGLALLGMLGAARLVLWQATDLIYAHRTGAGGVPVYGPLLLAFSGPQLVVSVGLILNTARRWRDRFERLVFLAGLSAGVTVIVASLSVGATATAELLTGYWIIPWVLALHVLFVRRVLNVETTARRLFLERSLAVAGLARSERRSRLALRSGGMGWFEYDPATQELESSPELKALLGLAGPLGSPSTMPSGTSIPRTDAKYGPAWPRPRPRAQARPRGAGPGPTAPPCGWK